jgi:hypothetical protein
MSTAFPRFESPGQLALVAIGALLIGLIFHPLSILAPLGVVLLLLAGVAYLMRPKSQTMYWRGRRIELDDGRSPAKQAYHMFFKR